MDGGFVDHGSSPPVDEAPSGYSFIPADQFYFISRRSTAPCASIQNCYLAYTAAVLSLLATIFYIWYGFSCLRQLGFVQMVGSGIPERMLAVAETGSFRRCIGDIDARASGTSTSPLQYARSSILTVASLLEANISGNDDEGPKAKQSAEVEEQHATMKQYVAQGVQHVKVKQAVERGGQYATVKKAVNGRDERPVPTEKPDLFYVIDPLAHIAEEAELRRLKEALRLPASDAVNLTKEDMKVLSEANEKLKWMMKTRSRLAVALRKKLEERERLTARMARMNLNRHPLHRVLRCLPGFGCLTTSRELRRIDLLNSDICELERRLKRIRNQMKVFLWHKQQRAFSLRLVAQRRIRGETLTAREADALSIAKLVTRGFRRTNYVPKPAEGKAILRRGVELSAALQKAVLRISNSLREASADSGCGGCSTCTSLRNLLAGCTVLQREAAMYALQLRSVIMTFPPEEFKEVIKNVEGGALQLRKKLELAAKFLENHSGRCD